MSLPAFNLGRVFLVLFLVVLGFLRLGVLVLPLAGLLVLLVAGCRWLRTRGKPRHRRWLQRALIALTSVPVAVYMTFFFAPLLLWIQQVSGMALVSHVGPEVWVVAVFYGISVVAAELTLVRNTPAH